MILPDVSNILPEPFDWCEIPAGEVIIEFGENDDRGTKTYPIAQFFMAKYPITNAQYQVFVDAIDGYQNVSWWDFSQHAQEWRKKNPQSEANYFKGDDLPRERVTWYEAMAFCYWLSRKTGTNITLPTEQQWQRATQGDDGREYPWGNTFDKMSCNTAESDIKQTTPVTQYPKGASPFGVMDMSGNVWEWTLSQWDNDRLDITETYTRVLRGGSWNLNQPYARSASRFSSNPLFRNVAWGFRLVCAFPINTVL